VRSVADGVYVLEAPQRFFGLEVGARMTALQTDDGLLLHSPLGVDASALGGLGAPRWVVAPNKLHHLYVGPWIARGAEAWGVPGLPAKRPDLRFAGVLDGAEHPFGDAIEVVPLTCFSLTNEAVLYHRPSRTLVVTDLLFHFAADAPWLTRVAMACAGAYPGCCTSVLERVGFDRPSARRDLGRIAALDFDRLVMAHGEVIDSGGRTAFREAFAWLGV